MGNYQTCARAALTSSAGQCPACTRQRGALVADLFWVNPETQRSGGLTLVACRPSDPASRLVRQQQKTIKVGKKQSNLDRLMW